MRGSAERARCARQVPHVEEQMAFLIASLALSCAILAGAQYYYGPPQFPSPQLSNYYGGYTPSEVPGYYSAGDGAQWQTVPGPGPLCDPLVL